MAALAHDFFEEWDYEKDNRTFDDTPSANDPTFSADVIEVPYQPRKHFLPFHMRRQRWSALVCHRRAGKTVACVAELVTRALYTVKKNARYAYVAPFFRQAKDVAWQYLKEMTREFALDIRESELRIILPNGAWITLYGADNPDALRGLYLDGAILDEFGDCRPNLWAEVILPTLMDRRGWCVFIGTPKGKNEFFRIVEKSRLQENWYDLTLKASDSKILSEEDLKELRELQTEDEYAQEFECSFEAAVMGAYYASLINLAEQKGKIRKVPWDPNFPVNVAGDLGFTDSSAYWFWQQRPDGIAIIDYFEDHSKPLDFYLDMFEDKPYEYDTIWLPHDARAKTLQTGRSTIEQFLARFKDTGVDIRITPQLSIQAGIDAGRMILPSCHFDLESCTMGIEALRAYRRRYDELTNSYSNKPLHDWSSHGADGFRYLALVVQQQNPNYSVNADPQKTIQHLKPVEMQLEPMWEERANRMRRGNRRRRI